MNVPTSLRLLARYRHLQVLYFVYQIAKEFTRSKILKIEKVRLNRDNSIGRILIFAPVGRCPRPRLFQTPSHLR